MKLILTVFLISFTFMTFGETYYRDMNKQMQFSKECRNFINRNATSDRQLASWNKGWNLKKIWPQGEKKQTILCSTLSDDGKTIYFLTFDEFDFLIMALTENKVKKFASFPHSKNSVNNQCGANWTINIDKKHIFVSNGSKLWHGKIGTEILLQIVKIPFAIQSAWREGKRIFILGEKVLISSDLYGKNRQTHISSFQMDKTLPMQRLNPNMKIFYGCAGNNPNYALLFIFTAQSAGVWNYNYITGKLEKQVKLPAQNYQLLEKVYRHNDNVFITYSSSFCDPCFFFRYSISANKIALIAYKNITCKKEFENFIPKSETSLQLDANHMLVGGFFFDEKIIYNFGAPIYRTNNRNYVINTSGTVNTQEYQNDLSLKLPPVNGLYPYSNANNLIAVEQHQVTKITKDL